MAKEEQSDDDEDWFDFDPLTDSASEAAAGPADTSVAGDDRVLTPSQRARLAVMEVRPISVTGGNLKIPLSIDWSFRLQICHHHIILE